MKNPGAYITDGVSPCHFCSALLCSFGPPSRVLAVITWRGGRMKLHDTVGVNCKNGATTENLDAGIKYMGYVCMLDDCASVI